MSDIKFNTQQKEELVKLLQDYFEDELDQELGQFDADFLLDFISKHIGKHFYNQGLYDAQKLVEQRIEYLSEEVLSLEK